MTMEQKLQQALEEYFRDMFANFIAEHEGKTNDASYSRKEALRYLNVSSTTLRQLELRGELVPARIGRKVIFRRSQLDRFLSNR